MAMSRISAQRRLEAPASAAPAVVLPFPVRARHDAAQPGAESSPPAPKPGERPTLSHPELRDWLKAALIASVAVHLATFVFFQLRFENDLERAAGAAASASSEGTVTIPIEIVAESMLPSAPSPTNASAADATKPEPTPQQTEVEAQKEPQVATVEDLMPPPPEPAQVVLPTAQSLVQLPPPPEPAPVVLPTREQARRLALPEEKTAPPLPVETARTPEAPARSSATVVPEEKPPLPVARPPAPKKQVQEQPQKQKAARSAPSAAASPSRAAAAPNSQASTAGASGRLDAGGRAAVSSYQSQVLAHLSRHRIYPPEARSQGVTGVARVRFALGRNGQVLSASLVGGSGEQILDQAALDMVRRASPFPAFPDSIAQARMDFAAPIRFDLR